MDDYAKKNCNHRRSTSSAAVPTSHGHCSSTDTTAVPEPSKSVIQNRRSTSARKADEAEEGTRPPTSVGLLLLSAAQSLHVSGEDPVKAKNYALKAADYLEKRVVEEGVDTATTTTTTTVELVMSLHLLAATLCKLGQFEEAIQVLQKSIPFSSSDPNLNPELAHASFSGFMQLGDTYFMLGQYDSAMDSYQLGLDIQIQVLGTSDLQVADTCRYMAESYLQLMQFKEAEELCSRALKIHLEGSKGGSSSLEQVATRRLMGLINSAMGNNEGALEQLLLANVGLSSLSSSPVESAFLDTSIGDTYLALSRYEEAVLSYHKALAILKMVYGERHTAVASIYISLADLYLKRGTFKEAKLHCEKALLIYSNSNANDLNSIEDIAIGLSGVAGLFESMGELKHAISLLQKAHEILEGSMEHQNVIIGGIEAQIGILQQMSGDHRDAYLMLKSAISKYSSVGQKTSLVVGMLLNQMGLACLGVNEICEAADTFEESKHIFEQVCGARHSNTLDVSVNLAGAYDAMGRVDHAINLLDKNVEEMENRLGTAHPEVEHARKWLTQMLKETGQSRSRKTHTLHDLLLLLKPGGASNLLPQTQ